MNICYLGIGSNLGNKQKNIAAAIDKVSKLKGTKVLRTSSLIKSKPAGGPAGQPAFLNAALKIKTNLPPSALLSKLKLIEKELGRKKTMRFGPRIIDLDILFYADRAINTKKLNVPHPRMFEREFVLRPLLEII